MKKKALVIGNQNYNDNELHSSINDANDITSFLQQVSFDVTEKHDLSYKEFWKAITDFSDEVDNIEVRLFYFSGHGINYKGKNYLIPIGITLFNPSDIHSCIDLDLLLQDLKINTNATNIIVLDCCNANPLNFKFKNDNESGFTNVTSPTGTIIGFAAEKGSLAISSGNMRNSVYTSKLLKHLKTPNLEIEKVFKYTKGDVEQHTEQAQKPFYQSNLIGDFSFITTHDKNLVPSNNVNVIREIEQIGYGFSKNSEGVIVANTKSTILFSHRLRTAFPGVRDIKWFYGDEATKGLKRFFVFPIKAQKNQDQKHGKLVTDPFWWFRDGSSESIEKFKDLGDGKILLGNEELIIDKIAIYNANSYYRSFIYIQTLADKPTGLYQYEEEEISNRIKELGYASEEFGLHNNIPIKRSEYDDNAAFIKGNYVKLNNPQLRIKYLSKYNFIITPKFSPYNSREGDSLGDRYMNAILKGHSIIEDFIREGNLLPRNRNDY
jgi:hypothetical protein